MNKALIVVGMGLFLTAGAVQAQEVQKAVVKADGIYVGLGGGVTFNIAYLYKGYYQDDTTTYKDGMLSDSNVGYIVYGGYQFNKIIALEASYTDYGSFSDTIARRSGSLTTFTSDPTSISVYANAGYTFDNGMRPFGQLGLGYMLINGSNTIDNIGIDDSISMRLGFGFEYSVPTLDGFGFRVAYVEDIQMDGSYSSYDDGRSTSTFLINANGMFYVSAQYKF